MAYQFQPTVTSVERYQYTKYVGEQFVAEFKEYREGILKQLPKPGRDELITYLGTVKGTGTSTNQKLAELLTLLANDTFPGEAKEKTVEVLFIFVKKFEVFRKIYTAYDSDWKKSSDDFSNVENYVLLSLALILAYRTFNKIQFLNAQLKINDVLCTQYQSLSSTMQALCHQALLLEKSAVEELEKKVTMILNDITIALTNSFRAHAYLQMLMQNHLIPGHAILLQTDKDPDLEQINKNNAGIHFDVFQPFSDLLKKHGIPHEVIAAEDMNSPQMVAAVSKLAQSYIIYTGGGILKQEVLSQNKKFIHVHPGMLPAYRGSTCMYYSILNEGNCGATSFIMKLNLDSGEILHQRQFPKPDNEHIDYDYDCYMRATVLVESLHAYTVESKFTTQTQPVSSDEPYYIIHPVLKHIAILSCVNQSKQ